MFSTTPHRSLLILCLSIFPSVRIIAEDISPSLAAFSTEERRIQNEIYLKMQRLIDWSFVEEPLSAVIERLRTELDCEVLIEHQALQDLGIDLEQPLSGTYSQISLQQALEHLLRQFEMDWAIEGRALVISTEEELETRLIVRVYDVHDLVVTGRFGKVDYDQLVDLIMSSVAMETWAENGGGEAEARPFRVDGVYALVVTQTAGVQRQIDKLLKELREVRDANPIVEKQTVSWDELQTAFRLYAASVLMGNSRQQESRHPGFP